MFICFCCRYFLPEAHWLDDPQDLALQNEVRSGTGWVQMGCLVFLEPTRLSQTPGLLYDPTIGKPKFLFQTLGPRHSCFKRFLGHEIPVPLWMYFGKVDGFRDGTEISSNFCEIWIFERNNLLVAPTTLQGSTYYLTGHFCVFRRPAEPANF